MPSRSSPTVNYCAIYPYRSILVRPQRDPVNHPEGRRSPPARDNNFSCIYLSASVRTRKRWRRLRHHVTPPRTVYDRRRCRPRVAGLARARRRRRPPWSAGSSANPLDASTWPHLSVSYYRIFFVFFQRPTTALRGRRYGHGPPLRRGVRRTTVYTNVG